MSEHYEADETRTEEDLRVKSLMGEWFKALPAIAYAMDNSLYRSIRTRANGGRYGSKHVKDDDYNRLIESFRRKVDKVESELEEGLVRIRAFRKKYLDK